MKSCWLDSCLADRFHLPSDKTSRPSNEALFRSVQYPCPKKASLNRGAYGSPTDIRRFSTAETWKMEDGKRADRDHPPFVSWVSTHVLVRERGFEPPHPCEYTDLNRARLPFRHSRLMTGRLAPLGWHLGICRVVEAR